MKAIQGQWRRGGGSAAAAGESAAATARHQQRRRGCDTLLVCRAGSDNNSNNNSRGGVAPTAFSYETKRLVKLVATRQAVKTLLNYLSETNGEQHLWLHNYCADVGLPLSADVDADEWIAKLASTPLTRVSDPRRSSVPSVAAAAAVMDGEREVSPRDVAERLLALRAHIAAEMAAELGRMGEANAQVKRRALEMSVSDFKPPEL